MGLGVEQGIVANRLKFDKLEKFLFPTEFVHCRDGFITAVNLSNEGYGIIPVINHPSRTTDVFHIMQFVFQNPQFQHLPFGSAMSAHHLDHPIKGPLIREITQNVGIDLFSVVNDSTFSKGRAKEREHNHGYSEFKDGAINILQNGGICGLAPQGRSGNIDQLIVSMSNGGVVPDVMGLFFAHTDRKRFDKFAVIFLGIVKPEKFSLKPFKKRVLIGQTMTKEEIKEAADNRFPQIKSRYERIARFCLEELYQLIH